MSGFVVGTSGYAYQHWKDVFYPRGLAQSKWLEYYAEHFGAVELNVTYYHLPKHEVFESWRKRTPDGFRFAIKGSRLITHYHRLHDVREPVHTFFRAASGLGDKLEVVLWQLPPKMRLDAPRLDEFCRLVGRDSKRRQAFEFREKSWFTEETYEILRRHGCALCIANSPTWETAEEITAPFTYLRFHGGRLLYGSDYSEDELAMWAGKARRWLEAGTDVYAFFNNDMHGYALGNARRLSELLGGMKQTEHIRDGRKAAPLREGR
jgi:uncharacterized protein YecE (DUF72 family)